jgi:hypothetical protein
MAYDPRTPEERRIEEQRRRQGAGAAGTSWWAWWWIWLIIILVAVWFAGWGWGGYGGWFGWGGPRYAYGPARTGTAPVAGNTGNGNVTGAFAANTVENVPAILNTQNKDQLAGDLVTLRDVKVQKVSNDGAVWVGPGPNQLLVVRNTAAVPRSTQLKEGESITINGTIERVQNANTLQKEWNLPQPDAQHAQNQGIYVQAQSVTPTPGANNGSAGDAPVRSVISGTELTLRPLYGSADFFRFNARHRRPLRFGV